MKDNAQRHTHDTSLSDKQAKKKKMAIVIIAACLVATVGALVMNLDLDIDFGGSDTQAPKKQLVYDANGEHRMSLWDPDWETDIFTVERWLDKNRYLTYVENGMAITITDGKYSDYGDAAAFMAEYFDTLMHGDAQALNEFYAESYFESNARFEAITMQKIYDMRMEYITSNVNQSTTEYVYKITYKILENDGTFRNDVVSDAERAQFYTIVDDGYELKITDVSYSYSVE